MLIGGVEHKPVNGVYQPNTFNSAEVKDEILAQAEKAIVAMEKYAKDHKKTNLFESEAETMLVTFSLKKPKLTGRVTFAAIQLANPDRNSDNSSMAIIVPDFKFKKINHSKLDPDVEKDARKWEDIFKEKHGVRPGDYTKVFSYMQFKRQHMNRIAVKNFLKSYDFVLVHVTLFKVMRRLFGVLGENFKTFPIQFNARSGELRKRILNAYNTVNLVVRPNIREHACRVGVLSQGKKALLENLANVLDAASSLLPGGLFNLRSVALRVIQQPLDLPIYVDFGSPNAVHFREAKQDREAIVEECSTLPDGLKIKINHKNDVTVVKEDTGEVVVYPTMDDEWEKADDIKPIKPEKLVKKLAAKQAKLKNFRKKNKEKHDELKSVKRIRQAVKNRIVKGQPTPDRFKAVKEAVKAEAEKTNKKARKTAPQSDAPAKATKTPKKVLRTVENKKTPKRSQKAK